MQFQLQTDNHIQGGEDLAAHVESSVNAAVGHFAERLTHVEAHLGDVTGAEKSSGNDKRCLLEARVSGIKNVTVSHQAPTVHAAIEGAVTKLRHALDSAVGKMADKSRRDESLGHRSAEAIDQVDQSAD